MTNQEAQIQGAFIIINFNYYANPLYKYSLDSDKMYISHFDNLLVYKFTYDFPR